MRPRNRPWTISRIVAASPRDVDLFHLRLLLLNVPGATGYEDLCTVNGVVHPTFKQAYIARGLIADNQLWVQLLQEAVQSQMPRQLRLMFAYMLVFSEVNNPPELWEQFRDHFSEDYFRQHERDQAYLLALGDILSVLHFNGFDLQTFDLPHENVVPREDRVDRYEAQVQAQRDGDRLNDAQRNVADEVLQNVFEAAQIREANLPPPDRPRLFFVDAPGGTGKPFSLIISEMLLLLKVLK